MLGKVSKFKEESLEVINNIIIQLHTTFVHYLFFELFNQRKIYLLPDLYSIKDLWFVTMTSRKYC